LDGRLSSVGIVVGHGGFSFGQPSIVVFVDEDSLIASLPVILDDSDGTKELSDVLRCGVSRETLDKYLVVGLDLLHPSTATSTIFIGLSAFPRSEDKVLQVKS